MPAVSKELKKIFDDCKAPAALSVWCATVPILDPEDIGLLCTEEREVEEKFIALVDPAIGSLSEKIACKKVWIACRALVDRTKLQKSGQSVSLSEEAVCEEDLKDTLTAWRKRHHYPVPPARLLATTLYNRRFKEVRFKPKRLSIILPHDLRTQACTNKTDAHMLAFVPGKPAMSNTISTDDISTYHELWKRIRADMTTIAHVSIVEPDYFSFADCERFSDTVLDCMHQTKDKQLAPVSHYIGAYIATMKKFSEEVTTNGKTLHELVQNDAQWLHYWTSWSAPLAPSAISHPPVSPFDVGRTSLPDRPADIQQDLNQRDLLRRMQSEFDRSQHKRKFDAPAGAGDSPHQKASLTPAAGKSYKRQRHR
jgi:hypothetical protein